MNHFTISSQCNFCGTLWTMIVSHKGSFKLQTFPLKINMLLSNCDITKCNTSNSVYMKVNTLLSLCLQTTFTLSVQCRVKWLHGNTLVYRTSPKVPNQALLWKEGAPKGQMCLEREEALHFPKGAMGRVKQ